MHIMSNLYKQLWDDNWFWRVKIKYDLNTSHYDVLQIPSNLGQVSIDINFGVDGYLLKNLVITVLSHA